MAENTDLPSTCGTPPGGTEPDYIPSIRIARLEAAATYYAWKKGTRRIKPHEMAIVVGALSNIAGMLEKESNDEIERLKQEVAELTARLDAVTRNARIACEQPPAPRLLS